MNQDVSPKQALFLWRMITGQTPDVREPMKSKGTPKLTVEERRALVEKGYISEDGRGKEGRGPFHLVLTDKAWAWAARTHDLTLLQSKVGAAALQGLLSYLLPFLHERELPLASLFADRAFSVAPDASPPKKRRREREAAASSKTGTRQVKARRTTLAGAQAPTLLERAEAACLSLTGGRRKQRVRLSALRAALPDVPRAALDQALLDLQDAGRAVLYRDDNSAALSDADHAAALVVGEAPRHIIYLEA